MRTIPPGPPVITAVTPTDEPGVEARVLCLVDGFPAEIHHVVNSKRQEYNRHSLDVFDPTNMQWKPILTWGFAEAGHTPTYPDSDTVAHLRDLSEVMWRTANLVVHQSRLRQEEIDIAQFAAAHMEFERQHDAYHLAKFAVSEDVPIVDKGELKIESANQNEPTPAPRLADEDDLGAWRSTKDDDEAAAAK